MAHAAWKSLKGVRRIQAEYKHLDADIRAKKFGFIKELTLPGDDLMVWELKLHNFDNDLPGGKTLNEDLAKLRQQYGQDYLLMRIEFPSDYPHKPFFVRLVSPRCQMYTGHVTAGGSVCLEALTLSGTPGSWQPDFTVESLINVVVINMIDCPVTHVQTATGPGGRSGPLRIDFSRGNPTRGYSSEEAKAAFHRTLANHQRMGWGNGDDAKAPPAARAPPAAAAAAGAGVAAGFNAMPGVGGLGGGFGVGAAAAAAQAAGGMFGLGGFGGFGPASGMPVPPVGMPAAQPMVQQQQQGFQWPSQQQQQQQMQQMQQQLQQLQQQQQQFQQLQQQLQHQVSKKRPRSGNRGLSSPTHNNAAAAAGSGAAAAAGAAGAAGGGTSGQGSRKRKQPGTNVINLCDDDSDDAVIVVGVKPGQAPPAAAAAGAGAGPSGQQQPQANKRARPIQVIDSDSDDSVKAQQHVGTSPPKRKVATTDWQTSRPISAARRAAAAAAAAAAGAGAVASSTRRARRNAQGAGAAQWTPTSPQLPQWPPPPGAAPAAPAAAASPPQQQQQQQRQQQQVPADPPQWPQAPWATAAAAAAGAAPAWGMPAAPWTAAGAPPPAVAGPGAAPAWGMPAAPPTAAGAGSSQVASAAQAVAAGAAQLAQAVQRPRKRPTRRQQPAQAQAQGAQAGPPPDPREADVAVQDELVVDGANGAPKVQLQLELPTHWDYSVPMQRDTVRLIPLPLPAGGQNGAWSPGSALPADPLEVAAAASHVDEGQVAMLTSQGLSRADALAALLMGNGSTDEAMDCAFNCQDIGGAAKVWSDMQPVKALDAVLSEEEEAAKARALATEAETILKLLERTAGARLTRNKIVKIERVQHTKLWKRFALRRSEIAEERGKPGLNERLLFHGTSAGTADRIVQEGFDMRLVNHASVYGNGVYFADHSSTAYDYCMRPDNAAAAAGFGAGGPLIVGRGGTGSSAAAAAAAAAALAAARAGVFGGGFGFGAAAAGLAFGQPLAAAVPSGPLYKMIIARVALGKQTTGQSGMRRPPDGFDSVNSGNAVSARGTNGGMYCHVVFDNDQCYPEYLVTLVP